MEVRYEELCANPSGDLTKFFRFLGVDPNKINLEFRSCEQHIIGNGMRLDSSSVIHVDERWKTYLSVNDLEVFDKEAGQLNKNYVYD